MTDLQPTVEAMADVLRPGYVAARRDALNRESAVWDDHWFEQLTKALQAALDQGGVVLTSKFADVCDYLLAWTGFHEFVLVHPNALEALVPKFKYDALGEAAQAFLRVASLRPDTNYTEARERLRRELDSK